MRALLEAGAEADGSPAQHQLVWLMDHYQQVHSAVDITRTRWLACRLILRRARVHPRLYQ